MHKMTDKLSPDNSERRPLSQYDNLASVSVIGTSPPVREELMFKDIKFQFDDINQVQAPRNETSATTSTSSPYPAQSFNKSVISDAKSIFFGLHKPSNNGTHKDENLPLMGEQESLTPKVTTPVASKLQNTADSMNKDSPNNTTNAGAASSLNNSNGSNNNGNGGSSKKQITLLVDDNDTSSLGQSYLNNSSSPSQVRM